MCSVLNNHQAPSRDIALKNGELGRLTHIISGGYWVQNGQTERAGESVIALLHSMPILQRHLGWTPPRQMKPGSVRCPGREKRMLLAVQGCCPVGSWVIVHCKDRHFIAQIIEILHSSKGNQTLDLVTLHEFTLSEALHHYYEMPVLHKPERHHLVVNSETIQFIINVQHDCRAAGCSATGSTRQRQERMESGQELMH
ncbi:hypothetical protein BT96DRAFT_944649 [Gymnopus androsaceus JB14]|uniref:Uncharacterized protein n=1 Tax=Gymnopus androsaceus JB14 TaxID=1447944 RepID=A0A6A4H3T7_9AGAR|nr:hypothetical protein BT96DRAFT_944649 [Gymnopus androsaceus JB14]